MRLPPLHLKKITWIITDSVSATNTPPMMKRTISCRTITATVPSAPPRASAPTSPMNTSAGEALNQRNPGPRAGEPPADRGGPPRARDVRHQQVFRVHGVAGDVGKNAECSAHHHR